MTPAPTRRRAKVTGDILGVATVPGIPRADIERHALAIAADTPVPPGYPRTGRAWPGTRAVTILRKVGWPLETVEALLPSATAAPSARHKPNVRQPVVICPAAWLEELARRLDRDITEVCRGLIADDE